MRCCARCGREDILQAASATIGGITAYYCDDPAASTATCYLLAKYSGFPELTEFL